MFKAFCDTCKASIDPRDNHLEMSRVGLVDKGQAFTEDNLHFCEGTKCLCQWIEKTKNRPLIITPQGPHQ